MKQNVTKFEVGKTYIMVSPCNTDARWKLEVVSRTEKTITVTGRFLTGEQIKRLRISVALPGITECSKKPASRSATTR